MKIERIVSLVPSVTESLFDLGAGDKVVGRTDYCVYPTPEVESIPAVGGTKNPDVARILALKPDLVIANQEENRPSDVAALQAAGIPVFVSFPRTVRAALDLLWELARLADVHDQATARIEALERLYAQTVAWASSVPPVRVFCPIWRDPWMTFNAATYAHDLLATCGAANVFAERSRRYPLAADLGQAPFSPPPTGEGQGERSSLARRREREEVAGRDTRYPRVTLDEVAALAPDLILLPSEPYAFARADMAAFAAYPDMPAVREGRILLVDGSLITWHGTRLGRALRQLPRLIQPPGV